MQNRQPQSSAIGELVARLQAGRGAEVEAGARQLLERFPDSGVTWQLLGAALLVGGRFLDAVAPLERAGVLLPGNAAVWDNLGLAHFRSGDCQAAERCFQRSLELAPQRLEAWVNAAANALLAGEAELAEARARRALELVPDCPEAHLNLGNALAKSGRPTLAVGHLRRALERNPQLFDAWLSLGIAQEHLGQVAEATASYRAALALRPDDAQAWSNLLFMRSHDELADPQAVCADHRSFGERLEAPLRDTWRPHDNDRDPDRCLRVGFVSGDFREHAVATFIEGLWQDFDRRRVQVFAYYNYPVEDAASHRLKALADGWTRIFGLPDEVLAAQLRAARIDILIDCAGHTAYNRLPLFARRPVPVQVSWLGYPATTGLSAIDYRLVSVFAAPNRDLDHLFTERVAYLPCVLASFTPHADSPEVGALPAAGRGYVTFASFNRPSKLGERVIALWSRVLRAVPDARLLLGSVDDAALQERLTRDFAAQGVAAERLAFRPRLPMREYLRLHREIDIILDTFPYTGGTTTNHALWMGVPVLTLDGVTLAQRQGPSILRRRGLDDWVADSEEDYLRRASHFAADLDALAALRASLRDRFPAAGTQAASTPARCLESAFRAMWRRWCAGLPAARLDVVL